MFSACVVIPVYNHPQFICQLVAAILTKDIPVLLVDDGSDDACAQLLQGLSTASQQVHLLRLPHNQGKGHAVKAGLAKALALGFSHGIQIDADGQHQHNDIPAFIALAQELPDTLISGQPLYDHSVPKLRYYSRYLTHIWVWINTLSLTIKDSMCGFRVYPLKPTCALIDEVSLGNYMDFDTEIMVKWYWRGGKIEHLQTQVQYPDNGTSHFRGWADNFLISKMHTRLFFGMLTHLFPLIKRHLSRGQSYVD